MWEDVWPWVETLDFLDCVAAGTRDLANVAEAAYQCLTPFSCAAGALR